MKKLYSIFFIAIFLVTATYAHGGNFSSVTNIVSLNSSNATQSSDSLSVSYSFSYSPVRKQYYYNSSYYSTSIDNAIDLFFNAYSLDISSNSPNERLTSLAYVQLALAAVDLYYITNDTYYLNEARYYLSLIPLSVNSTFILGEHVGSNYLLYAEDNLLLAIAYTKLSKAARITDPQLSLFYRVKAANVLGNFTQVFYNATHQLIADRLYLDEATHTYVASKAPYATARSTGLFFIACYNFNDSYTSPYYNLAAEVLTNYFNNTMQDLSGISGFGLAVTHSFYSEDTWENIIDLLGNVYMAAGLSQLATIKNKAGNSTEAIIYNYYSFDITEGLYGLLYDPNIGFYDTYYNLTSHSTKTEAYTYENSILVSYMTEYFRKRYQVEYTYPAWGALLDIFVSMANTLYQSYTLYGGIASNNINIPLDWSQKLLNPAIVTYQLVSTFLKVSPFKLTVSYDINMRANQESNLTYYISTIETSSIFSSSMNAMPYFAEIETQIIEENFTDYITFELNSTYFDGIKLSKEFKVNSTIYLETGGFKSFRYIIRIANTPVLLKKEEVLIYKILGLTTDPKTLEAVEGYDDFLTFTINCRDEADLPVPKANISIYYGNQEFKYVTDNAGTAEVHLNLKMFLENETMFQSQQSTVNRTLFIVGFKDGYEPFYGEKRVTIIRNTILLTMDPARPSVKQGSDLTIYLSVKPQIPGNILNPRAKIYINNVLQKFNGLTSVDLPKTVTLDTSQLKTDAELSIYVSSDNLSPKWFNYTLVIVPLTALEKVYQAINYVLNSVWGQVLGSLGIVWALLWTQMKLHVFRIARKCPYCGATTSKKKPVCKNCGEVLNPDEYAKIKAKILKSEETP